MKPNRLPVVCATVVMAAGVACLLTWLVAWRPLDILRIAEWLYLTPLMAIGLGIAAYGLRAWAVGGQRMRSDSVVATVAVLGFIVLIEHLLVTPYGIERLVFPGAQEIVLGGAYPGRPSSYSAICLLFLAASLWFGARRGEQRFGPADVFAAAVLFIAFTATLGYLYQAPILVEFRAGQSMSLPEAFLFLLLAVGMLAMNPQLSLAGARDDADAMGFDARRQLLPAAILTPALLGLAQAVALRSELLDPVLAVALTSVAGIMVSVVLIEWVSGLLAEREAEKEGEFKQRETRAREEGMTDALTGLLNRRGWEQRFQELEEAYKRDGGNACVIVIDLDGLKQINDTQGHAAGDALIRRAARALEGAGRRGDFIARLGGDEFAYLAVNCMPQHADVIMERLAGAMLRANVHGSMGYAMRDLAGSLQAAFKEADEAMYADKRSRKARRTA